MMLHPAMSITVQHAADRFVTDIGWLDSKHSFNFGGHYRAGDAGHGLLLVNNDDIVAAGGGFGTHGHRDMEIVTWVLSGRLEHSDSEGNHGVLYPGLAQRMSAGSGIRHSEMNASDSEPVHFVQMWVLPDTTGVDPGYEQRDINDALASGGLVPIASGQGHDGAVSIHQRAAVLWGARVAAGASVDLPPDQHVHAFVALGGGTLSDSTTLSAGDSVRISDPQQLAFTAGDEGAELLVWATA
jgi:quercetin 2,3-dioxygenase